MLAPGFETEAPVPETAAPGSEMEPPGSEMGAPGSEMDAPGSEIVTPGPEMEAPGSLSRFEPIAAHLRPIPFERPGYSIPRRFSNRY